MMDGGSGANDDKWMKLRYAGVCRLCGAELPARAEAVYERATKTVRCVECPSDPMVFEGETEVEPGPTPVELVSEANAGVAGSSARREYERRKAKDEERLRQKWGKLGGIAVAMADEKQSTKAWATGAVGEERLGTAHPWLQGQHRPHRRHLIGDLGDRRQALQGPS
jgi:hypothetical protein